MFRREGIFHVGRIVLPRGIQLASSLRSRVSKFMPRAACGGLPGSTQGGPRVHISSKCEKLWADEK